MTRRLWFHNFLAVSLLILVLSCAENRAPVIEPIILSNDTVETNSTVEMEVVITDADNDAIHSFWFFNSRREPAFDYRTKVVYTGPKDPGIIEIMVVADDGKTEVSAVKSLVVILKE